jgi:hypothetical protein
MIVAALNKLLSRQELFQLIFGRESDIMKLHQADMIFYQESKNDRSIDFLAYKTFLVSGSRKIPGWLNP